MMNASQIYSLARSVLKIIGAGLVVNGYISQEQYMDVLGALGIFTGLALSHQTHDHG